MGICGDSEFGVVCLGANADGSRLVCQTAVVIHHMLDLRLGLPDHNSIHQGNPVSPILPSRPEMRTMAIDVALDYLHQGAFELQNS